MTAKPPQIDPDLGNGNVSLVCVGRDLGTEEVRKGYPFANRNPHNGAGYVFKAGLDNAGLRRRDLLAVTNVVNVKPPGNNFEAHSDATIEAGLDRLYDLLHDLQPNCVLAMGNEASYALVEGWPTKKNSDRIKAATGIQNRRGFLWEGRHGGKVVTTVHPSFVQRGGWVPYHSLFLKDVEKAKREAGFAEFDWPQREAVIPSSSAEAAELARDLHSYDRLAADIELGMTENSKDLGCVGFAGETDEAVIFPGRYLSECSSLLMSGGPDLIWANGQFDARYLLGWHGLRTTVDDDVQLAWHALYCEIAGRSSEKDYEASTKALHNLASLYTRDPWWKAYDWSHPREMYELNAIDCCVTLEVMRELDRELDEHGVRDIYEHELDLVWPVVEVQDRGIVVDERLRQDRMDKLQRRYQDIEAKINKIVIPLIQDRKDRIEDKIHLFKRGGFETETGRRKTCPCCRNGTRKTQSCTNCFGVKASGSSGAILKQDLITALCENNDDKTQEDYEEYTKDELRQMIPPCEVCNGDGKRVETHMNPRSDTQQKLVLYELLKAPKRYNNGTLTTDEISLRSLLGEL